ncbi:MULTISPECIES: hypothetical protein [unclassified Tolypothrix]|uniref:hypothetical protein n=1 Tax=unclassified Tolypothrix TaxID=2649714 RepID=UPI0005EAC540|nr:MULTISPECIES: hypothetical protein [unclassified Tolypothrix]BAY90513.1 hypothetical protein NIES3275_25290 [Microchaete diplosiphon NIES-3275]EKF01061.1 hypothetical protein FDUTEX481_08237 [Tolypothrix sp. PCC 7601]MBE9086877.1 hypothetical protein [Tolypothrix sp. LEGE 11397]UYD24673.1 hypothetical protein HGR01_25050 [Tolypothrix sp. PCC 7712]UYD33098.1 hypothetical protein HG267_29615 [Tolypothrix sp. PCC 7601]
MLTLTPAEISQFRSQLADSPEALAALDAIEECEGYLDDAIPLLVMRETAQEADRGLNDWLEKIRQFVCQEEVRDALESGFIAPIIEPLAASAGIPLGTATALSILVFKLGAKKFCKVPESDA